MKLIDKDKVATEIEKRKIELQSRIAELGTFESNTLGLFQDVDLYDDILSLLDTLELKEVDLEKDFDKCCENYIFDDECDVYIARRFFELGLKAQRGE